MALVCFFALFVGRGHFIIGLARAPSRPRVQLLRAKADRWEGAAKMKTGLI